ncbi:uncharacterized protein A1O9_07811 [Exophiala aquamarina CBS 119918]|uniref:DUF2306 domain-containing protein n=1 Tax=Exophiala aquamarina CBS 119918 TaxID=1182545 RepID=A0A072PL51_9EURO|nr:uncharacterized protein A1O9_07811 [Exophiala aquamarina CBS 119918]KEF56230.1 hypothetical protein A1O9_07811 [Exophiala aquamarina CBS 119918]
MPNDDPNDSWHHPKSTAGKGWVKTWRKIYHPLGFKKGYNFPLFVICVGILMYFVLSRFKYLDFDGVFLKEAIPGDATHYLSGHMRIGMMLHLGAILPAGLLACFQFVPVIRHKIIMFHRLNGYVVILLFLVANAGAYMITPEAAGGSPATQVGLGTLATATTVTITLSYINIKRLQIDQHRAWMLRTWFYAGSIITLRVILMAANTWITEHPEGNWYTVQTCSLIWKQYVVYGAPDGEGNPVLEIYPQCLNGSSTVPVIVKADNNGPGPEYSTAAFHLTFGMSVWLAFIIHAIAVELYLALTPAESERLRVVSYERQLKAGLRNPGRSGLTVDRLGDAPTWKRLNDDMEMDSNH